MSAGSSSVRIVGHEASRTGAPRLLLTLGTWLRDVGRQDVAVTLLDGGPLEPEYRAIDPGLTVLGWRETIQTRTTTEQVMGKLGAGLVEKRLVQRRNASVELTSGGSALMYLNTVATLRAVPPRRWPVPTILHVHELAKAISSELTASQQSLIGPLPDHVIAPSEIVAENLLRNCGVSADRLTIVPEFLEEPGADAAGGATVPATDVLAAAHLEWRKGPDLFLQSAMHQRRSGRSGHWTWLGAGSLPGAEGDFRQDVEASGLAPTVSLLDAVPDITPYLRATKVFALTSREDPYPLVALMAMRAGLPVVCYANTGGIPALVARGAGTVVPYGDPAAFAEAVQHFLDDPEAARQCGLVGQRLVEDEHRVGTVAPAILEIIERTRSLPAGRHQRRAG